MLREFWKDEEGSVIVFTAISMIALIGFTALVVDVGSMTNERSLLQNAADAAALAGVVQNGFTNQEAIAKQYAMANTKDVKLEDITVTQLANGDLRVEIVKDSKAFFSQVLTGSNTNRVAAYAVATKEEVLNVANVAIWAQQNLSLTGNNFTINGNVYAYNYQDYTPENDHVDIFDANGIKIPAYSTANKTIPDYSYLLTAPNTVKVSKELLNGKKNKKKYEIDDEVIRRLKSTYPENTIFYFEDTEVDSELVIKKEELTINVITNGDITFNGSGETVNTMILYTTNGDITFNGSSPDLRVLLYSPTGTITFDGAKVELSGSAVAQHVTSHGSGTTVTFADTGVGQPLIPKGKLVE